MQSQSHISIPYTGCTGCSLCAAVCPVECISMTQNEEGFQIPAIDEERCIHCGKCLRLCPAAFPYKGKTEINGTYALQLRDKHRLQQSASGGAFYGIAAAFLRNDGIVYAVTDDVSSGGAFQKVSTKELLQKTVGSKYYQCNLTQGTLEDILECVKNGEKVLFAGTPCQVAAVRRFIPEKYSAGLYTVDIICQGTPSQKVVSQYHRYMERKYQKTISEHYYRNKEKTMNGEYTTKLVFDDGSDCIVVGQNDLYNRSFSRKLFLRESCYECRYTNLDRISDVTIGDFWGLQNTKIDKSLGVSLALTNTRKGVELLDNSSDLFIREEHKLEEALPYNKPLTCSAKRGYTRSIAYKMLDTLGFAWTTRVLTYRYYVKKILFWWKK